MLYHYRPLAEDWFHPDSSILGKSFRDGLPIFPEFPFDKSVDVWKDQAERMEAMAMPSKEFGDKLKYVFVYGSCSNCGIWVEGKIKLENGYLIEPLCDIKIRVG